MAERTELQRKVETVIKYSQDYPFSVDATELMEDWYKAKKFYIDLFGGELIINVAHVSYSLSPSEKAEQFQSFLEYCGLEDWFDCRDEEEAFKNFLVANEEGFFDNKVIVDDSSREIKKGMKLSKCFKSFFTDNWSLRQAQDAASRVMQADKFEGNLYLSIHPLDFLTLGENNHKWRSCHALDGEYRGGNLSYMVDDTTIIAYLASNRQEQLRCMPEGMLWNSKKWRMLVHTNQFKSVIYYNRQYPFTNEHLLYDIHYALSKLPLSISFDFYDPNDMGVRKIIYHGKEFALPENNLLDSRNELVKMSDIVNDRDYTGYCDLLWSPHYTPVVSYRKSSRYAHYYWYSDVDHDIYMRAFHDTFDITIGKKYKCLKCGSEVVSYNESFLCEDCIANEDLDEDRFMVCSCCGSRIYDIDEAHEVNGEYYCTGCYMNLGEDTTPTISTNYTDSF